MHMPHRRLPPQHDTWHPPPPAHSEPWSGWTTHEIQTLRQRLHDLQIILQDVTDELDKHTLMIEAEQKAARDSWGTLIRSLLSNPTLPYFGALAVLLLATWLSGDKKGALETAKSMLTK